MVSSIAMLRLNPSFSAWCAFTNVCYRDASLKEMTAVIQRIDIYIINRMMTSVLCYYCYLRTSRKVLVLIKSCRSAGQLC